MAIFLSFVAPRRTPFFFVKSIAESSTIRVSSEGNKRESRRQEHDTMIFRRNKIDLMQIAKFCTEFRWLNATVPAINPVP